MAFELREKADAGASDIVADTEGLRAELTRPGHLVLDPFELPAELVVLLGELPNPLRAGAVEYQLHIVPCILGFFDQGKRVDYPSQIAVRMGCGDQGVLLD